MTSLGLKSMENGILGEARAKAFLLERFWVLERTVDIQGADYLIQRRLTDSNFMDRSPPKLGVIQVKYVQDGNTYVSISKDYICGSDGEPYNEFFLLVLTGRESSARIFLFSAREILENFNNSKKESRTYLKAKASNIFNMSNNEVLDQSRALNRIDHALINADFMSNRKFLGATSYVKISPDHIDHDLLLPLDNHYDDIGKTFFREKKNLQSILYDIEDVVEGMNNILRSTDPEAAFEIYEDVIQPHIGTSHGVVFSSDFFRDEDFLYAVQNHKARLTAIRQLGLESAFFSLLDIIESIVPVRVAKLKPSRTQKIRISLIYDKTTLSGASVKVHEVTSNGKFPKLVRSECGEHVIEFCPYDWQPHSVRTGEQVQASTVEELKEVYRENCWMFRRPFQSEIEKHLIGEELALGW